MAPIRRYLRITKYSVLEVRIYLDNPSLASSWLLHPRKPILPHVIEAVRPLVLPKLREENERDKNKGKGKGRKKGVKDVVVEDDFEVSVFLTEISTRHSLLTKQRHFREKGKGDLQSNSDKLTGTGTTSQEAIEVEDRGADAEVPFIPREDSDEDMLVLQDIPLAEGDSEDGAVEGVRGRSKRRRAGQSEGDDDEDGLFVDNEDEQPLPKRTKDTIVGGKDGDDDDKKKMAMDTSYDGFSIYGRVLCLVVKKRDTGKGKGKGGVSGGHATMMEEWITSTQMPVNDEDGT